MEKRPLGKTGMHVSEIAFGGVEIGMPYGIGVETSADMIAEPQAIDLLHASFDAGINFYDTARQYGRSESIIGKAFKDRRDNIIVCTKCRHFLEDGKGIPPYESLKKVIEASLRESLSALRTDYVDVFMLHQGNMEILNSESVSRIFLELKASGAIRATGVSTYSPEETAAAIQSGIYDVIQLPFNLMDQRQAALFPLAIKKGIGVVVRSVLMKGLLSDRGRNLHRALKAVEEHIGTYDALLNGSYPDLPTLATKFALSYPEVSSILIGLDKMEYLHKSVTAANGHYLADSTLQKAKSLAYPDAEFLNLSTWSKKGWLR